MASGGMDWAYRMIGQHKLDPLGGMIVLHLGWRDAAGVRTDAGIARALGQHRTSVRKATAKLAALGLICRRSGQWVAVETVNIVEGVGPRPMPDGVATKLPNPRQLSGQQDGNSVANKRKEKRRESLRAAVRAEAGAASFSLSPDQWQRFRAEAVPGETRAEWLARTAPLPVVNAAKRQKEGVQ